jgi:hypothetical protein
VRLRSRLALRDDFIARAVVAEVFVFPLDTVCDLAPSRSRPDSAVLSRHRKANTSARLV